MALSATPFLFAADVEAALHYENTPIQIYRKFDLQKLNKKS